MAVHHQIQTLLFILPVCACSDLAGAVGSLSRNSGALDRQRRGVPAAGVSALQDAAMHPSKANSDTAVVHPAHGTKLQALQSSWRHGFLVAASQPDSGAPERQLMLQCLDHAHRAQAHRACGLE